jgi:hypothetical protein
VRAVPLALRTADHSNRPGRRSPTSPYSGAVASARGGVSVGLGSASFLRLTS